MSLEQLEKYWGNDERWSAATAEQRGKLFHARFGAAMEAVAARRQVSSAGCDGCIASVMYISATRLLLPVWDHAHLFRWHSIKWLYGHSDKFCDICCVSPCLLCCPQAEQQQREADYRALLRELKVTSTSRWSLTKADMADHPAAEQLPPDQREKLFRAYVAELQVNADDV